MIGGAFSYATQAWKNKSFTKGIDWKQVAGSAAEGAITGGIGGLTMGASLAATAGGTAVKAVGKASIKSAAKELAKNTIIDGASGFAGNTASQLITGGAGNYSVTQAVTSGVVEALNIPGGPTGEKTAKKVGSEVFDKVTDAIGDKAGREVAEEAGSNSLAKTLSNSSAAGVNGTAAKNITKKKAIAQYDDSGFQDFYHGNSKKSKKRNHVYIIADENNDMIKVGVSGQKLNKNGTSPRANRQKSAFEKKGMNVHVEIIETDLSRIQALDLEQKITDKHAARNNGLMPSIYYKRPRPQVESIQQYVELYGESPNQSLGKKY